MVAPTTVAAAAGVVVGAATAVVITTVVLSTPPSNDTFRQTVKHQSDDRMSDCSPWPFTAAHHPTHMFRIELQSVPINISDIRPKITEMDVTQAPWTDGDPNTAKPYVGVTNWAPVTPLDLNLDLAAAGTTGKHSQVLIQVVVADQNVRMIDYPFTVISNDAKKKMFCKWQTGTQPHQVTFAVNYLNGGGSKVYGSYSVGLMIPTLSGGYFPIYLDPEVQNNG